MLQILLAITDQFRHSLDLSLWLNYLDKYDVVDPYNASLSYQKSSQANEKIDEIASLGLIWALADNPIIKQQEGCDGGHLSVHQEHEYEIERH